MCTYCSADKHFSESSLSAIQLYKSNRIIQVFEKAKKSNTNFLILSGKYGLVYPSEEIQYYDHLLMPSEVENHSDLIATQIKSENITSIEFYMNSIQRDNNLQAYFDCISKACAKASIVLEINIDEYED